MSSGHIEIDVGHLAAVPTAIESVAEPLRAIDLAGARAAASSCTTLRNFSRALATFATEMADEAVGAADELDARADVLRNTVAALRRADEQSQDSAQTLVRTLWDIGSALMPPIGVIARSVRR